MVVFTDGETRCVPFTAATCWHDWTFAWRWEARKAALLAKPEPQQRAPPPAVGRRLFFKVDGRTWREVELQRPCTVAQWERLQAHLEQEEGGVAAGGAPSPDGSERGADGSEPPRKGGDSQGKGSKALRKAEKEKEKPKAAGAAAKGAAAKAAAAEQQQRQQQQEEEGRGGWWQARCTEVPGQPVSDTATLLIRVTAATLWEQWAQGAEASGGEGGKGGEEKTGSGKKRKRPPSLLKAECPSGEILKVLGVRARAGARAGARARRKVGRYSGRAAEGRCICTACALAPTCSCVHRTGLVQDEQGTQGGQAEERVTYSTGHGHQSGRRAPTRCGAAAGLSFGACPVSTPPLLSRREVRWYSPPWASHFKA